MSQQVTVQLKDLTDQQLISLYDQYSEQKRKIDKELKKIREEAARRLNEKRVKSITYIDAENDLERGFEWASKPSKSINYELLKMLVGERYSEVVTENTSTFVKFIKRKMQSKTVPNYTVPEGTIV